MFSTGEFWFQLQGNSDTVSEDIGIRSTQREWHKDSTLLLEFRSVLDGSWLDRSLGLSRTAIQENFARSTATLLNSTGVLEQLHVAIKRGYTLQFVRDGNAAPACGSLIKVSVGLYDWVNNVGRVLQLISLYENTSYISASMGLVELYSLNKEVDHALIFRRLFQKMPPCNSLGSDLSMLPSLVPLSPVERRDSPAIWDYKAILS